MVRNPCPSKIDFKVSSFDPTGNFDCKASVNFLLAVSKCGQSSFVITPCAIGGGLELWNRGAMRIPTTKSVVGLNTNKPIMAVAITATIDTNQIPPRFTFGSLSIRGNYCSCATLSCAQRRRSPAWIIRDRVGQFFLPINLRFAPKADLIASTDDDSARRATICKRLIPAKKTEPERACKKLYLRH